MHLPTLLQGLEVPGTTLPKALFFGILVRTNSFFRLGGRLNPKMTFLGKRVARLLGLSAKSGQLSKMDFLRLHTKQ